MKCILIYLRTTNEDVYRIAANRDKRIDDETNERIDGSTSRRTVKRRSGTRK